MGEFKPIYAPLPLRALGDDRLSRADLVTLAVVAAHDRFGKNRTGCFASYARLADMTHQCERALKRSLQRLGELGYIRVEANPMDARRRVLFVEYTQADAAAMRGSGRSFVKRAALRVAPAPCEIGVRADTDFGAVDLEENPPERRKFGVTDDTENAEFGVRPEKIDERNQSVASRNIFPERENRLREAPLSEQNSADPVPRTDPPALVERDHRPARSDGAGGRSVLTLNQWLWRSGDDPSPSEIDEVIRERASASTARPSAALLATAASRQARAWGLG